MDWKISSNNHLWLHKGWPEFAEHYRIKIGHLLLFNHQESSNFQIRIFDRDSCEITYFPFTEAPQMKKEIGHPVLQTESSFQEMEGKILNNSSRLQLFSFVIVYCRDGDSRDDPKLDWKMNGLGSGSSTCPPETRQPVYFSGRIRVLGNEGNTPT